MPRLGDDPNMATAYPDRVNLRGSWMRQLLYTMVCTLVLYKVVFTDYRRATKESMVKKGLSEKAQEKILHKTTAEKQREVKPAKETQAQRVETLTYELGNLTNAVTELQKLAADHYGVTLAYPVTLGDKEEGDEGADAAEGEGGEGGDAPTVNLRGAGADRGNPDGSGGGDGDGGDGDAVDAGGDHARRLLTREKGEPEGQTGPAAAAATAGDEPAALRGGSGGPRQLEGGPRREG